MWLLFYVLPQPEKLVSPTLVLRQQKGNSFDHSVLLCSLLLGVGYDAYCVCGYGTREVCMMDQTRNICPLLEDKLKVYGKIAEILVYVTASFVRVKILKMITHQINMQLNLQRTSLVTSLQKCKLGKKQRKRVRKKNSI